MNLFQKIFSLAAAMCMTLSPSIINASEESSEYEFGEVVHESMEDMTLEDDPFSEAEDSAESTIDENQWETEISPVVNEAVRIAGGNTIVNAVAIGVNTEYTDSLPYSTTQRWYKITVPAAGKVSITFKHEFTPNTSTTWKSNLINEKSQELIYLHSSGADRELKSFNSGIPAGTYYMNVNSGYSYNSMNYSFRVNYEKTSNWETEINNSMAEADPIAVNTDYHGSMKYKEEKDWYELTLSAPGKVSLTFEHDYIPENADMWNIALFTERSQEIFYLKSCGSERKATSSNTGLSAGHYYVRVSTGYMTSHNDYSFRVNYAKASNWETEVNNSFADADRIVLNQNVNACLSQEYDKDYFVFTVPGTKKMNIDLVFHSAAEAQKTWSVTIYDAATKQMTGCTMSSLDSNRLELSLEPGDYYLVFEKARGLASAGVDYDFVLREHKDTVQIKYVPIYRVYNPNNGEHLFTSDEKEYAQLGKIGWKKEGIAWNAPSSGRSMTRLYNKNSGEHHYTSDANEIAHLQKIGWSNEGVKWYSAEKANGVVIHRLYNPNAGNDPKTAAGAHHYTLDTNEKNVLAGMGWKWENNESALIYALK